VSIGVADSFSESSLTEGGPETELASVDVAVGVLERELRLEADRDLEVRVESCFGASSSSITPTTSPSGATTS
jgi:hypothetical protein